MKITLCGSTKFKAEYIKWNLALSKSGHIVYSVAGFGHSGDELTVEEKAILDDVHIAKIDNSDAIVVLNVNGYVGESTGREIRHAQSTGKEVYTIHPMEDAFDAYTLLIY